MAMQAKALLEQRSNLQTGAIFSYPTSRIA
jgi:hypothetical protein